MRRKVETAFLVAVEAGVSAASGRFTFTTRFILIVFAVVFLPCLAHAKRARPAKVEPVTLSGRSICCAE